MGACASRQAAAAPARAGEAPTRVANGSKAAAEAVDEVEGRPVLGAQADPPTASTEPDFEFEEGWLNQEQLAVLQRFADSKLVMDPSSAHFMHRAKAIAFVLLVKGEVYSLEQDFFVQHEGYNDFSGGFRRTYAKIKDEDLRSDAVRTSIRRFARHYSLPDHALILLQIQRSSAPAGSSRQSVTGQGIHSDGANRGLLVCIQRRNVAGAHNSFYRDLEGETPLSPPTKLGPGNAVLFKDDTVYHYVSPAHAADPEQDMERTMMLLQYPADHYLSGTKNTLNSMGSNSASIQLRDMPAQAEMF